MVFVNSLSSADFFMAMMFIIAIDDWWKWYDLNIPDDAWISIVQNSDLDTLIEIKDPAWILALQHHTPEFLKLVWIH